MEAKKKALYRELGFCGGVFLFIMAWMVIQPFNVSPDEQMRYQVIEYLVKHTSLPHGGDAEIRHHLWGISYAFNPILSSIISAVFVKITSLFTDNKEAFFIAARMVNVFLGTATAFLTVRIGKRLFKDKAKILFAVLVLLLPGTLFIFSYINNDGLAIFSTALIILMWARAMQDGWEIKTCIGIAIGISVCILSYYNAYGVILCSVVFFVITMLMCQAKKWDWQKLFKYGGIIIGIVLVLAGWWFVRSYIIYDGDFLGMATSSQYAEQYAQELFRPSNRWIVAKTGMTPWDMLFYVPGEWQNNWVMTVAISFVGTFGYMNVFMPEILSKVYIMFIGIGIIGVLLGAKKGFFYLNRVLIHKRIRPVGEESIRIRVVKKEARWNSGTIFRWCMLGAIVVPAVLLVYYAYFNEFQAQGRYLLPALIPLMYFVTWGYERILDCFVKNEKIRKYFYYGASALLATGAMYTYLFVFAPQYWG